MFNMVYWFIGILKELDLITEEGYHALSKELSTKILPSNSADALQQVKEAIEAVEKTLKGDIVKVEPWLMHINNLESRVTDLEKSLTKKKA